ncbi:MAG: energy transducer TonB [Bacteroidetes bacterium]|nr:energy transducer TonB [Bacteroidota bacterium]
MKIFLHFTRPITTFGFIWSLFISSGFAQAPGEEIQLRKDPSNPELNSQGINLAKQEKYEEASQLFSEEIKKNETNRDAYFNRGVVKWQLNDVSNACRDWSAVLALGDTETFKLLDKNCHGSMVVDEDTIPSAQYHKMWANEKKDDKTMSSNANAKTIVDEMPEFPGGTDALIEYFQKNIKATSAMNPKNRVDGRVYVNFIISRKGKILFPYVTRGIGKEQDAEAIRVIKNMPAWKPGKQGGKPVLVRYNLPVHFSSR